MPERAYGKDLTALRNRSRGALLALLMLLVVASIFWYIVAQERTAIGAVQADETEAVPIANMEPFYVLLIGSDLLKGTALYTNDTSDEDAIGRADVLTLVRVDTQEQIITLLTVPRDTLAVGRDTKVCAALSEDNPEFLVEEVERICGVDIRYYLLVHFAGFEDIVDALGGVVVNVPNDVAMLDPMSGTEVSVSAGPAQMLSGKEALAVVSCWENTNELEALRQACVRAVEREIIEQTAYSDEETIRTMLAVLNSNVETNMEDSLLVALALAYAADHDTYTIYSGSGPYQGRIASGAWVISPDEATWERCMEMVDAGGDPNSVVVSLSAGA